MNFDPSPDGLFYSYNEVEPGVYYCAECSDDPHTVIIDKKNGKLPECPKCKCPTCWSKL